MIRTARIVVTASLIFSFATAAWAQRTDARMVQSANAEESTRSLLKRSARLNIENVSLEVALNALTRASGVPLAFSPARLPRKARVSCVCSDVDVRAALDRLLAGASLEYVTLSGQVVLFPEGDERSILLMGRRNPGVLATSMLEGMRDATRGDHAHANDDHTSTPDANGTGEQVLLPRIRTIVQEGTISGQVVEASSQRPLAGAQVHLPDTEIGTLTDQFGRYRLDQVPAGTHSVSVVLIGYSDATQTVEVASGETVVVNFQLRTSAFDLDEIVVTGQATSVSRRNLANAVATVSADELVKTSTASVTQALMGKVPSAMIQNLGGGPGGGTLVRLRGTTSLNNAYTPLYVVDGVIVSNARVPRGINRLTRASGGDNIATDQEQPVGRIADLNPLDIERIEVLKGASASAIYGSKASNGVIIITTKRGQAGAPQFRVTQRLGTSKMFRPVGFRIFDTLEEAVETWGPTATEYWTPTVYNHDEELAGRTPLNYETTASVNGGSETTRYYASAVMRHEGGIITGTYADKQSLRLNLDQTIGDRTTLRLSSAVIHNANDRGITGNGNAGVSYYDALTVTPSFVDLRQRPDGTWPVNPYANSNPLQTAAEVKNDEDVWRMIVNGHLDIEALSRPEHTVKFNVTGGVDNFNQKNAVFSPPHLQFEPLDGLLGTSVLTFGQGLTMNLNGNLVHTYEPLSGAFSATTSAGVQYETREMRVARTLSEDLVGGLEIITSGTSVRVTEDRQAVHDLGLFAQTEVLIKDRILLTVGGRADKSSNNSDVDQLFFYPKASLSYRFPFSSSLIDELKLRAAVGESGNLPLYRMKFSELEGRNLAGVAAFRLSNTVAADDIRPERQREIEAGLDAALFGNRGSLALTVYSKRISDLLLRRDLTPVTGFDTQVFNGGIMRTNGLEVGLNVVPIQTRSFQWNSHLNYFMSRSKILELPVPTYRESSTARFGTLQIEEGKSPTQVIAWDSLPDGTRVDTVIGDYNPDFNLTWSNEVSWGNFGLDFTVDHYHGGWIHNYTELLYDFAGNTDDYEVMEPNGEMRGEKRIRLGTTNSSKGGWMQPMTNTKLREASLTFEVPQDWVQRIWPAVRSLTLSLSGRNLLILTDYRGGDPEVLVRASSLSTQWRSDVWPYPPYRTFWLSMDLSF